MRIATLTFHRNCNYGANLQAYALQRAIISLGHDTELLDYDYQREMRKKDSIIQSIRKKIDMSLRNKENTFKNFRKVYLKMSEEVQKGNLGKYAQKYDRVIVGSDQVWNYFITQSDSAFLLDFVPAEKRCSYAASFGISEISNQARSFYEKLLPGFHNYSVRERTGAKLLENLIHEKAVVDLDPVGLLTVQQWNELFHPIRENGYIFLYMPSARLRKYALELSAKFTMKIAYIGGKSLLHPSQNIGELYTDISPKEFLSLLYYADYVVTGSFHGTMLSILFNKEFCVDIPETVGSRIVDLLEDFDLTDHIISSTHDIETIRTDWNRVNMIMTQRREKSLRHLTHYLS